MNKCDNECISKGKCEHNEECHDDVCFTSVQSKAVEKLIAMAKENERAKTIEEYKNKVWEDIEARYKSDIKILGYLSAENLLKDVHNSLYYFAERMKGDKE